MLEEHGHVLAKESLQLLGEEDPLEEEKRDRYVSILSIDLKEFYRIKATKVLKTSVT